MIAQKYISRIIVGSLIAVGSAAAFNQQDSLTNSPRQSVLKSQAVEYLYPEQVSVAAGKPTPVSAQLTAPRSG